jgi:hypothetical protein
MRIHISETSHLWIRYFQVGFLYRSCLHSPVFFCLGLNQHLSGRHFNIDMDIHCEMHDWLLRLSADFL